MAESGAHSTIYAFTVDESIPHSTWQGHEDGASTRLERVNGSQKSIFSGQGTPGENERGCAQMRRQSTSIYASSVGRSEIMRRNTRCSMSVSV